MCPSCRESLAVAESPQAYAERDYIRKLIAQGLDKQQIERNLVGQYGPAVLAKPPASGFNLTVYVLPAAIVIVGLADPGRRAAALAPGGPRRRPPSPARPAAARLSASRTTGARGGPGPGTPTELVRRKRCYIDSGAETPSSPSVSAMTRWVTEESAIRKDSTRLGVAPTTRHCS